MAMSSVIKKLSMATASSAFIAFVGVAVGAEQAQAYNLFSKRTIFQNQLSTFIVDDYENLGYLMGDIIDGSDLDIHTNASMSSVLGETRYKTTTPFGGPTGPQNGYNLIVGNSGHRYCAGCNGSFLLDFTKTSIGNALGVFGAGFDILAGTDYFAHVIFGDDSTQDFSLASVGQGFWGITSDKSIKGIHVGLAGGGSTQAGYIEIDNLTIGSTSVPEPASVLGLLAIGALGAGLTLKRKHQWKA